MTVGQSFIHEMIDAQLEVVHQIFSLSFGKRVMEIGPLVPLVINPSAVIGAENTFAFWYGGGLAHPAQGPVAMSGHQAHEDRLILVVLVMCKQQGRDAAVSAKSAQPSIADSASCTLKV